MDKTYKLCSKTMEKYPGEAPFSKERDASLLGARGRNSACRFPLCGLSSLHAAVHLALQWELRQVSRSTKFELPQVTHSHSSRLRGRSALSARLSATLASTPCTLRAPFGCCLPFPPPRWLGLPPPEDLSRSPLSLGHRGRLPPMGSAEQEASQAQTRGMLT